MPRGDGATGRRYLVVNPFSFARHLGVELPQLEHPPKVAEPVVAAGADGERKFAVVNVPSMGFAWIEPGPPPAKSRVKPIAHENVLRNEFFEVTIGRASGGIQSLFSFRQRGNQFSQQIAMRLPVPNHLRNDPAAEAPTRRCVPRVSKSPRRHWHSARSSAAARCSRPTASAWPAFDRRRRCGLAGALIDVEIELDDIEEPRTDPWNSYYAARFAWPSETAELWRGVGLARGH